MGDAAPGARGLRGVEPRGGLGPLGVGVQPYGRLKAEDARAAYVEQIKGLAAGGVDVILFETFNDLSEMLIALEAARDAAPELPVMCQIGRTA